MKLRNKKTGKIKDFGNLQVYAETENTDESQLLGNFDSFKQILEYYEDYIPKEPLIKDEKIRKAIRAWAEANRIERAVYVDYDYRFIAIDNDLSSMIDFGNIPECEKLQSGRTYDIDELCGEE